jgi:hypothetical protein
MFSVGIQFLYRQIFALFFLFSFSIIVALSLLRGRNIMQEISTVFLVCFVYGIIGLVINFLLKLIFTIET